ncbi:pantothenate kinase [Actinobacillus equuli]|nr:pantothenate kinase [Actinobacillus equuli]
MSLQKSNKITPFLTFDRQKWAELRKSVPLKLTEQDLKPLLGFNEDLSLEEVSTIYLPLARLINYYIEEILSAKRYYIVFRCCCAKSALYYQYCRQRFRWQKYFGTYFTSLAFAMAGRT